MGVGGVDFDPNKALPMTATITLGQWRWRTVLTQEVMVGRGWTQWIDQAIRRLYGGLPVEGPENVPYVILADADGNTLHCSDDEDEQDEWLFRMVIGANLTAPTPEASKGAEHG